MSAISTALPRISEAMAIDIVDRGWKFEPLAINTRIKVSRCSATKKKIVGGRMAKNSSLSFSSILCMALLIHCSRFHHENRLGASCDDKGRDPQKFTPACIKGPFKAFVSVKPFFLKSYFM